MTDTHDKLQALLQDATKHGRLIEAGWLGLRLMAIPKDAPPAQLEEMRLAFFAGAQHLFNSLLGILDPGAEPTPADLNRMAMIDHELQEFLTTYKQQHGL